MMDEKNVNFSKAKVLILGDVMLDRYWFGNTTRISPEAPVPIVNINAVDERPGGAANVAANIQALGAEAILLGLVGDDEEAKHLEKLLSTQGIQHALLKVSHHKTITKLRVLSHNQQMIRLDKELAFKQADSEGLKPIYLKRLKEVSAVVLSDYGKGTLIDAPWFIQKARELGLTVIVDPKSTDFSGYAFATVVTPNMKELEAVVGVCERDIDMIQKSRDLMKNHHIENLVVTRSEKGLACIPSSGDVLQIPALAREVHDVTGAGDTVVAVLATALASKMNLMQAANLGNIAAGIAVSKLGTAKVSLDEIKFALKLETNLPQGVVTEKELLQIIKQLKSQGEKLVFTNGCFDILHAGHVLYLEQAKKLGDKLIVAVNDNASVKRLKGESRPINDLKHRMTVMASLKAVDWVVSFSEDTPERLISEIAPHVLVKGGDYHDIASIPGAKFVLSQGGEVKLLGLERDCSTTLMMNAIQGQKTPEKV